MLKARNKDLLLELLRSAIQTCYDQDYTLIERNMERASVSRIFLYMHDLIQTDSRFEVFKDYNLDCEYNKNGENRKWTPRCKKGTSPDLILHKRRFYDVPQTEDTNLLVVEFKSAKGRFRYFDKNTEKTKYKKETNIDKEVDFVKLEDFTNQEIYNYFLGVFVRLKKDKPEYIYFQKGKKSAVGIKK